MVYTEDGRSWSFKELDLESNQVAHALAADGVGPQDRIAYLDKNVPEYFTYLYGGAKLNAVSVAVNWRLAPPEMEYILANSESKVLMVGAEFLEHLGQMDLPGVSKVVVIGDPGDSGHQTYEQWIANRPVQDPALPTDPHDTCYQLYTSGTTGLPKGVELTHDNFLGLLNEGLEPMGLDSDAVNLVCMPLFHIAGSGWGVVGQFEGAETILLRDVDLGEILRAIPEHRITHSLFVPAVLQFLLATPGVADVDFSSMRRILYGASPISEEVLVNAMNTFGCEFMQAYGLTETTGAITLLAHEDHDPGGPKAHLLRSCGKAIAGAGIKIVDTESLSEVADGEVGEIWIKGRQNMKAYWKNDKATEETLVGDGWLRTGDAGYLRDADDPNQGLVYDGRLTEEFKLLTGNWVAVGAVRVGVIDFGAPVIEDAVVVGENRDMLGLLVFPNLSACQELASGEAVADVLRDPRVIAAFRRGVEAYNADNAASSRRIARALLMDEPPSVEAGEITDKGYVNQRAVIDRRGDLVERLYTADDPDVIRL